MAPEAMRSCGLLLQTEGKSMHTAHASTGKHTAAEPEALGYAGRPRFASHSATSDGGVCGVSTAWSYRIMVVSALTTTTTTNNDDARECHMRELQGR
ncbi:hypothetical protein CPLU01_02648 [Colletotrichum plurivorum]|uniref:Uncharacterized protein n=1 Tax=Colletotrichum plurivorum TaxID=2175906 RepID=A0A8H6NMG5_9PEZI|nr:hypothetical protein CPLU01_02648 [Colletotrichum plurivorum]